MKKFFKELWSFFWDELDRKLKVWALIALPLFALGFLFGFLFMPVVKGAEWGAEALDRLMGKFLG